MITFETQKDFENAVMCVIAEKLGIKVRVRGDHFVNSVEVSLYNTDDYNGILVESSDSTW